MVVVVSTVGIIPQGRIIPTSRSLALDAWATTATFQVAGQTRVPPSKFAFWRRLGLGATTNPTQPKCEFTRRNPRLTGYSLSSRRGPGVQSE